MSPPPPPSTPVPLAGPSQPVDWMFAFKFNAASFPGCTDNGQPPAPGTPGLFGGTVAPYPNGHSQQYVFATSAAPQLAKGTGCLGATLQDPLGATFASVYNNPACFFVLWNDQFYNNPMPNADAPWGHSKGLVAWDAAGDGLVLQVSTPSWPASGSSAHPRQNDGNTLGCVHDDDIQVSQHFFALRLAKSDLVAVLSALANASVATSTAQPSLVNNGGPVDVQALVRSLGQLSTSTACTLLELSTGVQLLSKPSLLAVPPWQLVSAKLGGVPLRVASWWTDPNIYSTAAGTMPQCWQSGLGAPGAVQIATSGAWGGQTFGLEGGDGQNFNHAKVGISTDPANPWCIFGDMNQQGALAPGYAHPGQTCTSSQNGRGGTFYALKNAALQASLTQLLQGGSAPVK